MEGNLLILIRDQLKDAKWIFHQGSTLRHKDEITQKCKENFPDLITTLEWLLCIPHLNPVDCFLMINLNKEEFL